MPAFSKKVCLLGEFAVGKTSLVRRFVYNLFDDKYISTIGVKVSRKTVNVPCAAGVVEVTMMLWDLAGSQEFDEVRTSYLRGTAGAVLVCDVTRPETLAAVRDYAQIVRVLNPPAQMVLVANKQDLRDEQLLSQADVQGVASELGIPFYLTSAKTGDEVETVFRRLGQMLVMPAVG